MNDDEKIIGHLYEKAVQNMSEAIAKNEDELMKRIIAMYGYDPDPSPTAIWRKHIRLEHRHVGLKIIFVDGTPVCRIETEPSEDSRSWIVRVVLC